MIRPGNIVLATAGKEKGEHFVVVKVDEKYVYLADGKRLKADKPKRKSYKHVKMFDKGIEADEVLDKNDRINAKFRKIIKEKESAYVKGRCD